MRYEKYEGTEYNAEMNMKKTKLKNANRRQYWNFSADSTLNELAEKHQISPATLSGWHKQFQEHAAEVLRHKVTDEIREAVAKERESPVLRQKAGRPMTECERVRQNMKARYLENQSLDFGGTLPYPSPGTQF